MSRGYIKTLKRTVPVEQVVDPGDDGQWLDLGVLAVVEISSEDYEHPVESALVPGHESGWRAGTPGRQVITLLFSPARSVTRVQLHFVEETIIRIQEYALRWSPDHERPCREIVRQQWNFSPDGAAVEIEDHRVAPPSAEVLELIIDPGCESQVAFASMERMRIG